MSSSPLEKRVFLGGHDVFLQEKLLTFSFFNSSPSFFAPVKLGCCCCGSTRRHLATGEKVAPSSSALSCPWRNGKNCFPIIGTGRLLGSLILAVDGDRDWWAGKKRLRMRTREKKALKFFSLLVRSDYPTLLYNCCTTVLWHSGTWQKFLVLKCCIWCLKSLWLV